jgi:hydroxymethylpyrimidine/phosphomethylpyrimidine kinase
VPIITAVAEALLDRNVPRVVDPVMPASSGARLRRDEAVGAPVELLFPLAT